MSNLLLNTVFLLVAAFGCLIIGGLILNELPMNERPGFGRRLYTYLSKHEAETRHRHEFPELEMRVYRLSPDALFTRIEHAVRALGWQIVEIDPGKHHLHAVVETKLFRFKDDVEVRLQLTDRGTEMYVHAKSRIGRGDLGANTRHILNLHNVLASQA